MPTAREAYFSGSDHVRAGLTRRNDVIISVAMIAAGSLHTVAGKYRMLLAPLVILATAGCFYPPPVPDRESKIAVPPEGKSILHAYIEAADPIGMMPSNERCAVVQVDDKLWPQEKRWDSDNRIVLEPGLHWIKVEVDLLLAKPSWTAFELDFRAGHEYSLAGTLTGCHALFGVGRNRVIPSVVRIEDYAEEQLVEVLQVNAVCANSEGGITCTEHADCAEGLQCVVTGNTGFGLCGTPNKKITE